MTKRSMMPCSQALAITAAVTLNHWQVVIYTDRKYIQVTSAIGQDYLIQPV